jgi:outer membrane lipoprotein-sorting protein
MQVGFEKIYMHSESKILDKNGVSASKSHIYYRIDGKLATHNYFPLQFIATSNRKGSIMVYDPKNNSVLQKDDFNFSSENSQYYFFFQGKKQDMGLRSMGFTLVNTTIRLDHVITTWEPPKDSREVLRKIKLVHKNGKPIYMSYFNEKDKEVKKTYYDKYWEKSGVMFPTVIAQFDYLPNGDSIITKTTYSNIKLNKEVADSLFNFQIPANAKLLSE